MRGKTRAGTEVAAPGLAQDPPVARLTGVRPQRALALPLAFTLMLVAFGLLPSAQQNPKLLWSFWGAGAGLLAWNAALLAAALGRGRTLAIHVVLRPQHYLQACAQAAVFAYWGWYWREVYNSVDLIATQLLFAYAFDILLTWSRRDTYTLGFGPFPIIFSTNLFLWFRPDWFYLQFLMVAVGFAAKELIRWNKEGRRVHIFNPSSFSLGLFSMVLILTGTTHLTWGPEIAATLFNPPQIYVMIFLVGLPAQYLFGVTSMTMSAVVTTYVFGLLYFAATGTYFFFDSYIPIAVFLGMHLLFNDPSTSPRTELGRIIFGMLYGLSAVVIFGLFSRAGEPTFYDKLLAVPILNLMIQGIDRAARSSALKRFDPAALWRGLTPRRRNLAYIGVWTLVFAIMSAAEGVGDTHRGRWLPFWEQACNEGLRNGCRNLALLETVYCNSGSGWACNELGILISEIRLDDVQAAVQAFERSCELGFSAACANADIRATGAGALQHRAPRPADYFVVLREGKGSLPDRTPLALYKRACTQGWADGCHNVAMLYQRGDGTARDEARAREYLERACELGLTQACRELDNPRDDATESR